jgi:2-amino-4-hydroxy-6-hydroxymethyldihydropteridine diphosphokinase
MGISYIALGSNMGDREKNLKEAVKHIAALPQTKVIKGSSIYETEPVGGPKQRPFYNAVVKIETALEPEKLLQKLQETEAAFGRVRKEKWGPRTLDLDILLYDQQIIATDKLTIPHPLMAERAFVLEPLVEIDPEAYHPVLEKTAAELLREFTDRNM